MSTLHPFAPRPARRAAVLCPHSSGGGGRQWQPLVAALRGPERMLDCLHAPLQPAAAQPLAA